MKLITLGTSHGAAEPGHFCSANLLLVNDAAYLIDCGGPAAALMTNMGIPTSCIKAVFITHMHEDHAGSLSSIAKKFAIYHKDYKVKILLPEKQGIEGFQTWMTTLHIPSGDSISFGLVTEGHVYSDENITVRAIPTEHIPGYPTYAYVIEGNGKKILFTGDLRGDFRDYPLIASKEDFDAIVCELTHCSAKEIACRVADSHTKKMIFSHTYPGNSEQMLSLADTLHFPIAIAQDGSVFTI